MPEPKKGVLDNFKLSDIIGPTLGVAANVLLPARDRFGRPRRGLGRRIFSGISQGTEAQNLFGQLGKERKTKKLISSQIDKLSQPTKTTTPKTLVDLEAERGAAALEGGIQDAAQVPTNLTKPVAQDRLNRLEFIRGASGIDPGKALGMLNTELGRKPEAFTLGPGQVRFQGSERIAEGPAKDPKGAASRLGKLIDDRDRAVQRGASQKLIGIFDSRINKLTTEQSARPLTKEESDLKKAQTELTKSRKNRIDEALLAAKNPKVTLGQLASIGNFLIRQLDSLSTPEEEKLAIQDALNAITQRVAEIRGTGITPQDPARLDTTPPNAPAQRSLDDIFGGR